MIINPDVKVIIRAEGIDQEATVDVWFGDKLAIDSGLIIPRDITLKRGTKVTVTVLRPEIHRALARASAAGATEGMEL